MVFCINQSHTNYPHMLSAFFVSGNLWLYSLSPYCVKYGEQICECMRKIRNVIEFSHLCRTWAMYLMEMVPL